MLLKVGKKCSFRMISVKINTHYLKKSIILQVLTKKL